MVKGPSHLQEEAQHTKLLARKFTFLETKTKSQQKLRTGLNSTRIAIKAGSKTRERLQH